MSVRSDEGVPTVAFRVDASRRIGMGHVMRCVTLANELRRRGAFVRFVSRDLPGHLGGRLRELGHDVDLMAPPPAAPKSEESSTAAGYAASLGVPEDEDARETLRALAGRAVDWLVVDHYALGTPWQREMRSLARRILVIDDLANRAHDCDVLLDQNWVADETEARYAGLVADDSLRLLGPRYALLQPEYAKLRSSRSSPNEGVRRVVVFFGGSDPSNETAKALDALASPEFAHLMVDVVVGSQHPDQAGIAKKVASRPRTTLHGSLPSLAALFADADLAIGAGGVTTWERICLGIPSIVTTVAENQEPSTAALARAGIVRWVGRSMDTTADSYRRAVASAVGATVEIPPLVDGLGTLRVAETIVPTPTERLALRRARPEDAIFFFGWRNEPSTRAMSVSTEPISWDTHLEWFKRKLSQGESELFVAEAKGLPIGQLRLDFANEIATLSYSVDVISRGRGVGKWMISEALRQTAREPALGYRAAVKPKNEASKRVFRSLGWTLDPASTDQLLIFRLPSRPINAPRVLSN